MKNLICFLCGFLILVSCAKPEDRECVKSAGDETEIEILTPKIDRLFLHEHLEYILVQDTIEKVVLSGGKNLVNFVIVDVNEGLLDISNTNKCNFLRSYKKKVKVEIHFIELINIHFEGTESLTNKDTLQFSWMTFLIRDGAGPVLLNFNADAIYATISHGWGDFTFNGTVNYANLNVRSNGFCDTYGLKVKDSLTVISNTQGYVKVNANNAKLKSQTDLDGDIYYKGMPSFIKFNQYGSGDLIDAN
ncbi:MAG: hypothetical protein RI883_1116 [Bacteroidota bacterium]|jgi:hypothetical protein